MTWIGRETKLCFAVRALKATEAGEHTPLNWSSMIGGGRQRLINSQQAESACTRLPGITWTVNKRNLPEPTGATIPETPNACRGGPVPSSKPRQSAGRYRSRRPPHLPQFLKPNIPEPPVPLRGPEGLTDRERIRNL